MKKYVNLFIIIHCSHKRHVFNYSFATETFPALPEFTLRIQSNVAHLAHVSTSLSRSCQPLSLALALALGMSQTEESARALGGPSVHPSTGTNEAESGEKRDPNDGWNARSLALRCVTREDGVANRNDRPRQD
jgi:hypothetical protein